MLKCSKCNRELEKIHDDIYGNRYFCKSCLGFLVNLALLQKISDQKFVKELWLKSTDSINGNVNCPICNCAMKEIKLNGNLVLDLCRNCHVVWFDELEENQIPITKFKDSKEMIDEVSRTKIAMAVSKMEAAKIMMKYPRMRLDRFGGLDTPAHRIDEVEIAAGLKERKPVKLANLDRRLVAFLGSVFSSVIFFFIIKMSNRYRLINQDIALNVEVALISGGIMYICFRLKDRN